jgi:molecular chaperone GrpE
MADISDLTDPTGKPLGSNTVAEKKSEEINVDFKDKYLRALADYKNLQRQIEDERKVIFAMTTAGVLERFLPVLDMLYQAEFFHQDEGMKMVKDQFIKIFEEMGMTEIDLLGKKFDPHLAEVVDTVDGKDTDTIVEVVKRGYMYAGKVIRVASVKVGKETK